MAEEKTQAAAGQPAAATADAMDPALLDKKISTTFKSKDDGKVSQIKNAVGTFAQMALENTKLLTDGAVETIESIIAELDRKLSEQMDKILHHAAFQKLEGTWRGLNHLVSNTETDLTLKIKVINISKKELGDTLKKYKGARWDQSPLFRHLYTNEYSMQGGEPYGVVMGDYEFNHNGPDVEILQGMAKIGSAAHCPFIGGASPSVMDMESWAELMKPQALDAKLAGPDHAAWRALREEDDAKYLGLAMPRFMSRAPYHPEKNPIDGFTYSEAVKGDSSNDYVWSNSAYALLLNIATSFKFYGWCSDFCGWESGGLVENLPVHTFASDDGGTDMMCPTETAMDDRRDAELEELGFLPLYHKKNSNQAAFTGGFSLQKPEQFIESEATASARLAANLMYLFAVNRFAHYLKCIVRDKLSSLKSRGDMEDLLTKWINQYVEPNEKAPEDFKRKRPLAQAKVIVNDIEGDPGAYSAQFLLQPHYRLKSMNIKLTLVSKMPSGK